MKRTTSASKRIRRSTVASQCVATSVSNSAKPNQTIATASAYSKRCPTWMKRSENNWSRPSECDFRNGCENSQHKRRQVMPADRWERLLRQPCKRANHFANSILLSESAAGLLLSGDSGTGKSNGMQVIAHKL